MQLHKTFFIFTLFIGTLFATPNITWNKNNIFIEVKKELLKNDIHLLENFTRLQYFYKQRQNTPIWLSSRGVKGQRVMQLLDAIQRDATLNPRSHLHIKAKILKNNLQKRHNDESIKKLELDLTALYYDFLQHTIYGEIDWKSFQVFLENNQANGIDSNWVLHPRKININVLMSKEDITQTLRELTPKGYHYKQLLSALYKLYKIKWQGGWDQLPAFKTLKTGQSSHVVGKLRKRLLISGDYRQCTSTVSNTYYSTCLQKAVKNFQKRHSVSADGIVGKGTQKLLNISVEHKINKVLLNLDRIKWLPRNTNPRNIIVNIPEYMLHYYEYGKEQKRLRVIVGDIQHPTPIFSDMLSYLTINPYWKLPSGIIKKEVIPAMVKNSNYIKSHGLEVHKTWEENSPIIPTKSIDWASYLNSSSKFPYRIMQPPSNKNALGRIKFKFPNKFSVYLHDTPTKHLFKKKRRAFSHGCVRLSQPFSLLQSLAKDESHISTEMVNKIIKSKKKNEIDITKDIPINLVYLTTWVDEKNQLIFGDDIYQYDKYQRRK